MLLSESLTGKALSTVCVCVSQAPSNASQSAFTLEFGSTFSKLDVDGKCRPVKPCSLEALLRQYEKQMAEAEALLSKRVHPMQSTSIFTAQLTEARQILAVLRQFLIKVSCFAPNYLHTILLLLLCLSRPQILDSIGIVEYAMVGERNEKFFSPDSAVSLIRQV